METCSFQGEVLSYLVLLLDWNKRQGKSHQKFQTAKRILVNSEMQVD